MSSTNGKVKMNPIIVLREKVSGELLHSPHMQEHGVISPESKQGIRPKSNQSLNIIL